jgi:hypothetical protein
MAFLCEATRSEVMIRVLMQPEPTIFDAQVRIPGQRFLRQCPHPTTRQWKSHAYWTRILCDLHTAYGGICAYSCHWIPYDTGHDTVEHFRPKTPFPDEAYEWTNYRLVCGTLNGRKGTDQNIIDPFQVTDGWFVLDFPSLLVRPGAELSQDDASHVLHTIRQLGLNEEGTCLKARLRYVQCYCTRQITFDHLRNEAPFIAREIHRQGLVDSLASMMEFESLGY